MGKSNIEWTNYVWNPVVGCTHAGMKGCDNCYARALHNRRHLAWLAKTGEWTTCPKQYWNEFDEIQLLEDRLTDPLHWKNPRRIFVNSMSDLFHPKVPFEFINKVFNTMKNACQHTYQILTKRPERALQYFDQMKPDPVVEHIHFLGSASTQAEVDNVVPTLLQIPAAVRGLSLEPLLGPIDLELDYGLTVDYTGEREPKPLDWIIVGCESGPNRRPCKIEWVEDIARQCKKADVACFVKQIDRGGKVFKLTQENESQWPDWAVQEYPNG